MEQTIWRRGEHFLAEQKMEREIDELEGSGFSEDGEDEDEVNQKRGEMDITLLEAVYKKFINLKNNGARWIGQLDKLSRAKFQGGINALLGIEISWHQFGK